MTFDNTCSHDTPVVDLKHRQSSRPEHPLALADELAVVAGVLHDAVGVHEIERRVAKGQGLAVGDGHGGPDALLAHDSRASGPRRSRSGPPPPRARRHGRTARPQLRRRNRRLVRRGRARRRNPPGAAGGAASRSGRRRGRRRSRAADRMRRDLEVVDVRVPVSADARIRGCRSSTKYYRGRSRPMPRHVERSRTRPVRSAGRRRRDSRAVRRLRRRAARPVGRARRARGLRQRPVVQSSADAPRRAARARRRPPAEEPASKSPSAARGRGSRRICCGRCRSSSAPTAGHADRGGCSRPASRVYDLIGRRRNADVSPELHLPKGRLESAAATQKLVPRRLRRRPHRRRHLVRLSDAASRSTDLDGRAGGPAGAARSWSTTSPRSSR